jgi:uncharacterized phage protein (TIGR01671 family)
MYFRLASIRSGIGENMEDRYLFKAKRIDDREWVIGYYGVIGERSVIIEKYAENYYCPDTCESRHGNQIHEVNSKTICQCTGLKDKNGKLIWENDIVKINNSKGNVLITFGDFEIICTIPNEKYYKHRLEYDTEYEVVGNVFDNAELLESEG